jgi:hypothetical protein
MNLLKERFHHKVHEERKGHRDLLVAFSMKIRLALASKLSPGSYQKTPCTCFDNFFVFFVNFVIKSYSPQPAAT